MRELGMPLNMRVVDKEFSEAALKLFAEANNARAKFYNALADYCKAPAPTKRRFSRIRRAMDKVIGVSNQAADFTSPEESEAAALQVLLTEAMAPFLAYWQQTLASIEEGETIRITITREMLDGWDIP
jgi:hypothetical protein